MADFPGANHPSRSRGLFGLRRLDGIPANALDRLQIRGLDQMFVEARLLAAATILLLSPTGERDQSLPRPIPALVASICQPCNSTNRLASVRPMPRPPRERCSDVSTWVNNSKMLVNCS